MKTTAYRQDGKIIINLQPAGKPIYKFALEENEARYLIQQIDNAIP